MLCFLKFALSLEPDPVTYFVVRETYQEGSVSFDWKQQDIPGKEDVISFILKIFLPDGIRELSSFKMKKPEIRSFKVDRYCTPIMAMIAGENRGGTAEWKNSNFTMKAPGINIRYL